MSLKQTIADAEKYRRIRSAIEQHLQSKAFENYMELADFLDYNANTLYQIMKGSRVPPDILAYKFCDYYGYDPGYFFGRSDKLATVGKKSSTIKKEDVLDIQKIASTLSEAINSVLNK